MDLLYFLKERLKFIQSLYDSTVSSFEEIKRKIEAGEPPYVDRRNPEYADGPAFLEEWQDADDSAMVIGHWCLCMVQASIQAYLRDWISPLGAYWWDPKQLQAELGRKKGDNWFERYRLLFLDLGIDWQKGSVPLSKLEELNLTRNDLIHNIDMMSFNVQRDEKHVERYPTGLFTDDLWRELGSERLKVDRDNLAIAIRIVTDFCSWLEDIRCQYPKHKGAIAPIEPGPEPSEH